MVPSRRILIVGAGEQGAAITTSLLSHRSYDASDIGLTLVVRAETLASLNSSDTSPRATALRPFRSKGVSFTSADLVADSEQDLTRLFAQYTCIIHAGAMTLPKGAQLKVTRAALAAEVDEYVPWQWGVDYDVIGREGGMGLFSEQCDVRDILRSQSRTKWFILSCGIFMSFLFQDFWGVVVRDGEGKISGVRALGGWDHLITATAAEDIAKCNAELLLVDTAERDHAVYVAGDTMSYGDFASVAEKMVGRELKKEEWTTDFLRSESAEEPENKLLKYRVVFSEGKGLAWEKKGTYNDLKGIEMEGIEAYMQRTGLK